MQNKMYYLAELFLNSDLKHGFKNFWDLLKVLSISSLGKFGILGIFLKVSNLFRPITDHFKHQLLNLGKPNKNTQKRLPAGETRMTELCCASDGDPPLRDERGENHCVPLAESPAVAAVELGEA